MSIGSALWGTNFRRAMTSIGVAIGALGGLVGAVAGVPTAVSVVEPYVYAHRGYVRDYDATIHAPILQRLIKVQLKQDRDERKALLDEAKTRELELQSEQAKQLPQYQGLIQQRVDRIKERLNELDEQDKSLFNEKK